MQIRLQQPLEALQCRFFLHFADATWFEEAAGDSLRHTFFVLFSDLEPYFFISLFESSNLIKWPFKPNML
jgi:hypothetical protein